MIVESLKLQIFCVYENIIIIIIIVRVGLGGNKSRKSLEILTSPKQQLRYTFKWGLTCLCLWRILQVKQKPWTRNMEKL